MTYHYLPQEQHNFCVPACLQMILQSRGFSYESQSKLYEECDEGFIRKGLFEDFLQRNKYSIHSLDLYVRKLQLKEFEKLVECGLQNRCNILVTVAYEFLVGGNRELNHALLVEEYDLDSDLIGLIDPAREEGINCDFSTLMNAMFTVSGGFHLFHPDLSLLENLKEKYF